MSVRRSQHFTAAAVITALLTGALADCGSSGSRTPSAAPTAAASGAGSATAGCPAGMTAAGSQGACARVETTAPGTALTAAQITQKLKDGGLPISKVLVYTEKTDPNNMMGRPGGYVGKAAFVDRRVDPAKAKDDSEGSAELGGSVEVFSTSDAAAQRAAYVQGFYTGGMLGSEYAVLGGIGVLLGAWDNPSGPLSALTVLEVIWEFSLSVWLLFRGFRPSPILAGPPVIPSPAS